MNATQHERRATDDRTQGTLGDVLYKQSTRKRNLPPEKDWVALARSMGKGDQLALRELYGRTYRLVFTLTMRIAGDRATAEELTVDVFHEAWRRAPAYDPADGTVIGWLMNIARSRAIDRVRFEQRKKRIDPRADEPAVSTRKDGADEPLVAAERGRQLLAALATLSSGERLATETAYFQDLTHVETASRLGEPLGTVKTRIRSGLAKLRTALEPEMGAS